MDVRNPIPGNYGYFYEKYSAQWEQLLQGLQNDLGGAILSIQKPQSDCVDMPTITVELSSLISALTFLKDRYGYSFLTDLTATDEEVDPRFLLVYHLMHLESKARVRIKAPVAEGQKAPTAIGVWPGANWAEREIFDMFGIQFEGHPDLRRILLDERWEGHPLRKDYPLRGYQVFLTPEEINPELLK